MKSVTNLLLIAFGLLIAAGAAEVVLRVFELAPEVAFIEKWRMRISENPRIGYEPIPNLDSTGKSILYYGYDGASNNMGFRDHDHPTTAPSGVKRVIVLGDSVTAGLWIDIDHETYPAQLEEMLKARGKKVEVMNFGVSGYNTAQEVETLKDKGLQFNPDLILLTYCLNDKVDDSGGIIYDLNDEAKNTKNPTAYKLHPVLRQSALYRFFKFKVTPLFKTQEKIEIRVDKDNIVGDKVKESFREIAEISMQNSIPVILVIFPDFTSIDKNEANYPHQQEHEKITNLALESGLQQVVDLLPAMIECKREKPDVLLSFDRYHPRHDGTRCAAAALLEFVEENLYQ